MLARLSLRLRIFLIFAGFATAVLAAVFLGLWLGHQRLGLPGTAEGFVQAGVIAGFAILGLTAGVWYLFDLNLAKPIDAVSADLRARAHAAVTARMDPAIARYLGDLAPAAEAAARSLGETRTALADAVARETLRLAGEKARLETLLSDVPVGVVLCSADHLLVFYNGPAADLLSADLAPGLDRRLFDYLNAPPLRHAYERLVVTGDQDAASDILCTTVHGAQVLAARMRLVAGQNGASPGYVLTLRDVTSDMAAHARREAMMADALDSLRRPSAALSALLEVMAQTATPPERMTLALRDEVKRLSGAVQRLAAEHEAEHPESWPLPQTRASDLAEGLLSRLALAGMAATAEAADLLLRCNGFDIIALLDGIALRMRAEGLAETVTIAVVEEDSGAAIRLGWVGKPLPVGQLDRWMAEPLEPDGPVPRQAVLRAHGTEIWPETLGEGRQSLSLPIRHARRAVRRPKPVARSVVYDFDLLSPARTDKLAEMALERLIFVVFDTETTGLLPGQGDEIVQIAAIRIVNGRRVEGEVFDTLVNPNRSIPAAATEVHGITDAMVADAPKIAAVARGFHKFAEGAVLVAHNAPFDMAFLRLQEQRLGVSFDMPVLDTVLLSAVIFGQHEVHSLDALTHRLGITIPEEVRHTALGDTVATAEAFLKLILMLQGRGLTSFGAVLAEVRRHGRLLKDLN